MAFEKIIATATLAFVFSSIKHFQKLNLHQNNVN
jgi:hypothetical protein